jgi:DnaJ-class molecular chaperone
MTLDQIEECREHLQKTGHWPTQWEMEHLISVSLMQAARGSGMKFRQCETCRGNGFTKMTLLMSARALTVLARECPDEPVPIQYDKCPVCEGTGGFVSEP